ncbi:MAG TPA: alpha/beta hydrolase [Albitalea sp.]|uniref:alpha/beta fold hydrolase n=1 Tax=Piscinibacter sp. TaxID=1903157 RepID=UPI002ED53D50
MHRSASSRAAHARWATLAGTAALLTACALVVRQQTRRAERQHPPQGRFVSVDGVRLHFTVHGRDEAAQTVVLLHGEGSLGAEFELSGLVRLASERYRVVVFDRPGHGHSEPLDHPTPQRQAELIHAALERLGVQDPVVVGHSYGALVALAMGLAHPGGVGSLVLASGYYFPTLRLDLPWMAAPALPGLGTLWRHTVAPLLARALWPLAVRRMFSPSPTPSAFRERFPKGLTLRPSDLGASARESASLLPATLALQQHYHELDVPSVLVAGAQDRELSTRWHSRRLHERLARSWLRVVEDSGHMVHHVATGQVMASIDQAAAMVWDRSLLLRTPSGLKSSEPAAVARPLPFMPCAKV